MPHEAMIWKQILFYSTFLYILVLFYKTYYLTMVYIIYCIKGYICAGFIFALFNHFLNQELSRNTWRH